MHLVTEVFSLTLKPTSKQRRNSGLLNSLCGSTVRGRKVRWDGMWGEDNGAVWSLHCHTGTQKGFSTRGGFASQEKKHMKSVTTLLAGSGIFSLLSSPFHSRNHSAFSLLFKSTIFNLLCFKEWSMFSHILTGKRKIHVKHYSPCPFGLQKGVSALRIIELFRPEENFKIMKSNH